MKLEQNEQLISALRELDTVMTEVTEEEGSYTDPRGKLHTDLPPFVRVALHSTPSARSNIHHEIWLPAAWNGCFHGTGNGGMAGILEYHTLAERIKMGYATINTDLGTSDGQDFGVDNPELWKDFGWRATYLMTRAGKLVTEAYYGRPVEHSYFWGGSTGGQQSLSLAQRFPEEYDGIIATVPANNRTHLHAYFLWGYRTIKEMRPEPFTHELLDAVTLHAVAYSRATGHSAPEDLFVNDPCADSAYIDGFIAYLAEHMPELTEGQREVLRRLYEGPVNPRTGERIYCGMPIGAESRGAGARCEMLTWQSDRERGRIYPFNWAFGADYVKETFDFDADLDRLNALLGPDMNANDPDLRPFFRHGGKLFMYSGAADSIVPFPEAVRYCTRMIDAVGGIDTALDGARYFVIPSQDHTANPAKHGTAIMNDKYEIKSPLDVLRLWREKGIAPDSLEVVTEIGDVQGKKTIYPYGSEKNPIAERPACADRYLN